ncbi:mutS protein homolog 5 isoform X1 [Lethenteron reissneri]|uniref:mutS protein homolog 5 isoform X1 n=1 Tax=Lethenteron reissneri TaxID=7753 RepID=UPI002AB7B534|nr:mutS protein homolog 5 isoform X1 [Lethenteron reissneri]XP_061413892.1 mutS protein homolog 5 isoform X1 [Lethenteron reissneri]XP_061413893.1 mutS protein homolog 5 isoform X1 [Lethenteron reissneri]
MSLGPTLDAVLSGGRSASSLDGATGPSSSLSDESEMSEEDVVFVHKPATWPRCGEERGDQPQSQQELNMSLGPTLDAMLSGGRSAPSLDGATGPSSSLPGGFEMSEEDVVLVHKPATGPPCEVERGDQPQAQVVLSIMWSGRILGMAFYDSEDGNVYYINDTPDTDNNSLLKRVISQLNPTCIITSAKQKDSFFKMLANPDGEVGEKNAPEGDGGEQVDGREQGSYNVEVLPSLNFLVEAGKQRILNTNLPGMLPDLTEQERIYHFVKMVPFDNSYMLCAMGALLKYVEQKRVGVELENKDVRVPIMAFRIFMPEDIVHVDKNTFRALQIFKSRTHPSAFKSVFGGKEGLSLFGIMNRCHSPPGVRLLEMWFRRPTRNLQELSDRQDVVEFTTSPCNCEVVKRLQNYLKQIRSLSRILIRMKISHATVQDWKTLYQTVFHLVYIWETCRNLPQNVKLFARINHTSRNLTYISSLLANVMDFESSKMESRCVVKPNVDTSLDEKKRTFYGLPDFMTRVARDELEELDVRITSCRIIYLPQLGYLLSVPQLPEMDKEAEEGNFEIEGLEFMFVSNNRVHYRSSRTQELDQLLGDARCEIRDQELAIVQQLQGKVMEQAAVLTKAMELAARLDCLLALGTVARDYGYRRPRLTTSNIINIKGGRHPLLELCTGMFVPNPMISDMHHGKMKVITGPNACGKSIYLKQVGLMVFMALIGSFVPAEEAEIGLLDGLYSRVQTSESISTGASTFIIDLNQMGSSIAGATEHSLVLVDEFGKGTNAADGLVLLAAVLRHWLSRGERCPHVMVSTHFHKLLQDKLLPESPLISLQTFETVQEGEELVFLYQLRDGAANSSLAVNVAQNTGLPAKLLQRATEVSECYQTHKPIPCIDQAAADKQYQRWQLLVDKFLEMDIDAEGADVHAMLKELISKYKL